MVFGKVALVPALVLLAGCNPIHVKYDYDPQARFTAFKTYSWYVAPGEGGKEPANPIMEGRVRRILGRELAARGFQLRQEGNPDFLLATYPVWQNRYIETYTGLGPAWGWGWGRPWGYGAGFTQVEAIREGSIVLQVVDFKTNRMVWQGIAEGALTGLDDPQDAEAQVTRAVQKLLARFPPPSS